MKQQPVSYRLVPLIALMALFPAGAGLFSYGGAHLNGFPFQK